MGATREGSDPVVDPGWTIGWRDLIPFLFLRYASLDRLRSDGGPQPPVRRLRSIFVSLSVTLVLLFVVLVAIYPFSSPAGGDPVAYLMLLYTLVAPAAGLWARRKQLECADVDGLAQAYVAVRFVAVAVATAGAFGGFAAAFIIEAYWPYIVGLIATAVGYALCAPTAGDLRRRDENLSHRGCPSSLREALYTSEG